MVDILDKTVSNITKAFKTAGYVEAFIVKFRAYTNYTIKRFFKL